VLPLDRQKVWILNISMDSSRGGGGGGGSRYTYLCIYILGSGPSCALIKTLARCILGIEPSRRAAAPPLPPLPRRRRRLRCRARIGRTRVPRAMERPNGPFTEWEMGFAPPKVARVIDFHEIRRKRRKRG